SEMVERQNDSTYTFYVKVAQKFLLVIGFMLLTMSVALNTIHYMKNKARKDAFEIQQKKRDALETAEEASHLRRKAVAIAYTNVLTGFKNRYAMEEDIKKRLQTEDFTVAVFTLDNFSELNESYGRNFGDMYLVKLADILKEKYSDMFDIYHTSADEFSFVLKKYNNQEKADEMLPQIIETLSAPKEVSKLQIKLQVSGCVYRYHASERLGIDSLFVKIDRAIKNARNQNEHSILELNSI
ncbi:MAG: diguanylate cyclase, partial [Oscillospiraceae bacterium]|nr:diguanylate cyclase [Oscillospiraceae bacterium]